MITFSKLTANYILSLLRVEIEALFSTIGLSNLQESYLIKTISDEKISLISRVSEFECTLNHDRTEYFNKSQYFNSSNNISANQHINYSKQYHSFFNPKLWIIQYNYLINSICYYVISSDDTVIYGKLENNNSSILSMSILTGNNKNNKIEECISCIDDIVKSSTKKTITNFRVSETTSTSINLNWSCSGKIPVVIFRDDIEIKETTRSWFTDNLLQSNTEFTYRLIFKNSSDDNVLIAKTEISPQLKTIAVGLNQEINLNIKFGKNSIPINCEILEYINGEIIKTKYNTAKIKHVFNVIGLKTIRYSPSESLKNINSISMSNCHIPGSVNSFLMNTAESLEYLDISNNPIDINLKLLSKFDKLESVDLSNTNAIGSFSNLPVSINTLKLSNINIRSNDVFDIGNLVNLKLLDLSNNNLNIDQIENILQSLYDGRTESVAEMKVLDLTGSDEILLSSRAFKLLFYLTINPHNDEFETWKILADVEKLIITTESIVLNDNIIKAYMTFNLSPNLQTINTNKTKTSFIFKYDNNNNTVEMYPQTLAFAVDSVKIIKCSVVSNITELCSRFPNVMSKFECYLNPAATGNIELLPKNAEYYNFENTSVTGNIKNLSKSAKVLIFNNTKLTGQIENLANKRVTTLGIQNCSEISGDIGKISSSITDLNIENCGNIGGRINRDTVNFSKFNMNDTTFDIELKDLNTCSNLKVLKSDNSNMRGNISDLKYCLNLEILNLKNTKVNGKLSELQPSLVSVNVDSCEGIELDNFCHLVNLKNINLSNITKLEDIDFFIKFFTELWETRHNFTNLNIGVSQSTISNLFNVAPNTKELDHILDNFQSNSEFVNLTLTL